MPQYLRTFQAQKVKCVRRGWTTRCIFSQVLSSAEHQTNATKKEV